MAVVNGRVLMDDGAFVGDVEHGVDASYAETETNEAAELHDLRRAELGIHTVKELGAYFGMSETETFSELNGQTLTIVQRVKVAVALDRGVFGFGDCWLRSRRSSSVQSNRAGIDLGDPHTGEFFLADGEGAYFEHRL